MNIDQIFSPIPFDADTFMPPLDANGNPVLRKFYIAPASLSLPSDLIIQFQGFEGVYDFVDLIQKDGGLGFVTVIRDNQLKMLDMVVRNQPLFNINVVLVTQLQGVDYSVKFIDVTYALPVVSFSTLTSDVVKAKELAESLIVRTGVDAERERFVKKSGAIKEFKKYVKPLPKGSSQLVDDSGTSKIVKNLGMGSVNERVDIQGDDEGADEDEPEN